MPVGHQVGDDWSSKGVDAGNAEALNSGDLSPKKEGEGALDAFPHTTEYYYLGSQIEQ